MVYTENDLKDISTMSFPEEFQHLAIKGSGKDKSQLSDKIKDHGYQEMYGTFLLPLLTHRSR
jgi:hypothetical protein